MGVSTKPGQMLFDANGGRELGRQGAVRGGALRVLCGDDAVGARLVLDDDGLAEIFLQLPGDQARHIVGGASRGKRQVHLDALGGVRSAAVKSARSDAQSLYTRLIPFDRVSGRQRDNAASATRSRSGRR